MSSRETHHLYLISDATGETVQSIAKACVVQFEDVDVVEHVWPMVRTERALETVLEDLAENPGLVMFTLLDEKLQRRLKEYCWTHGINCLSVMEPFISAMAAHFKAVSRGLPGRQHALDENYFSRIEAINFVMAHDDGQKTANLDEAEVILVGVSRTSKTPTSIYLANRGIKAANVPIIPGLPLPEGLLKGPKALVVGLTEDPRRLVEIRRTRMKIHAEEHDTAYTDLEEVKAEVVAARRLFEKKQWPVFDVTRRSIEETAASIIQLLGQRQRDAEAAAPSPAAKA